jgi:hypothetical protein
MSVLEVLKNYQFKNDPATTSWRHDQIIKGKKRMNEELQRMELEADYQAMKSREDRIKAILAEKETGPLDPDWRPYDSQ